MMNVILLSDAILCYYDECRCTECCDVSSSQQHPQQASKTLLFGQESGRPVKKAFKKVRKKLKKNCKICKKWLFLWKSDFSSWNLLDNQFSHPWNTSWNRSYNFCSLDLFLCMLSSTVCHTSDKLQRCCHSYKSQGTPV